MNKQMLLQRPKPFPDESIESYFIRVANKNGYHDVHRFLMALKHYLIEQDESLYETFPTDINLINPCYSRDASRSRTHALHTISQLTFNQPADILSLGRVDLCCTYFIQQYIGSHIIVNASDTILA